MAAESMSHPAKGHMGLWQEILERYTEPGQWVLDPMAGIGTTLLGCLMGRNVICVELEQHFVEPMLVSWRKMRQSPMLGCTLGQALIIRGDARALPLGKVDAICTSPPYEGISVSAGDQARAPGIKFPKGERTDRGKIKHDGFFERGYTRPVDAVVTSPPYEGSIAKLGTFKSPNDRRNVKKRLECETQGYTRPVDAVVTSPPYEGVADSSKNTNTNDGLRGHPETQSKPLAYGGGENIGNLKGEKYWEAMRLVYAECYRVLTPGGVMVLVIKGHQRDSEYVDLPLQTLELCQSLGFRLKERWERELWSLSFWRILQGSEKKAVKMGLQMGLTAEDITEVIREYRVSNGKLDDRLRVESVLVFERCYA